MTTGNINIHSHHADSKICEHISKGDKIYEDMLYIKYREKLFNYGFYKCKDKELTKDILQETIIISIENIRKEKFVPKHEGHVLNSMKRIFSNHLNNFRRKEKKTPKSVDIDVPIPDFLQEENEKTPYLEILKEQLEKLNKKCRDVIVAIYYKHLSMREILDLFPYIGSERGAIQYKYRCINKLKESANKQLVKTQENG